MNWVRAQIPTLSVKASIQKDKNTSNEENEKKQQKKPHFHTRLLINFSVLQI